MTLAINDLGEWTAGQLSPSWEIPLVRDTRVFDLTGVVTNQLSVLLYNASKANIGTGTGTFIINNVVPAVVTYSQAATDMTATLAYIKIKVNFSGTNPDFSDFIKIKVVPV